MRDGAGVGKAAFPVRVTSEVGRLRRALVHEPGREIDLMVPSMMQELLFDDILHGETARSEHRLFRKVLRRLGVEAIEALDLLSETLATPEGRGWVETRVQPHLLPEFRERIGAMDPAEMAQALVGGIRRHPVDPARVRETLFGVRPLPNWCFQRDTQVVLGRGVLFSAMATSARHREALLSEAIFRFHPSFEGTPVFPEIGSETLVGASAGALPGTPSGGREERDPVTLEGGDVLVLSEEVIVVGGSERTTAGGIEALVRSLARRDGAPRRLLRVELPRKRAYMHLDTLFTPVSPDACLVFPPVILPGHPDTAEVWEYDLHSSEPAPEWRGDLPSALAHLGFSFDPIPCGGSDPMHQQREQWTDGANALAVAPGVVILYDRNVRTAEEMDRRGYRVIGAEELLAEPEGPEGEGPRRRCILVASNELSRARGGPHCLTHPLERDPI